MIECLRVYVKGNRLFTVLARDGSFLLSMQVTLQSLSQYIKPQ